MQVRPRHGARVVLDSGCTTERGARPDEDGARVSTARMLEPSPAEIDARERDRLWTEQQLELPTYGPQADRCRRSRCCVCMALGQRERGRVVPHHEPPIGRDRGSDDDDTVPLCDEHHGERHGPSSGALSFWARYRVDWRIVRDALRRGAVWDEWQIVPF